jgi:hypothetical protein
VTNLGIIEYRGADVVPIAQILKLNISIRACVQPATECKYPCAFLLFPASGDVAAVIDELIFYDPRDVIAVFELRNGMNYLKVKNSVSTHCLPHII